MLVFLGNRTTKTITSFILLACWIMCVCVISRHGHRGQEVSEQKIPKQQNLVSSHVSTIQSHLGFFAHVIILSITRFEVRKRFNISHYLSLCCAFVGVVAVALFDKSCCSLSIYLEKHDCRTQIVGCTLCRPFGRRIGALY